MHRIEWILRGGPARAPLVVWVLLLTALGSAHAQPEPGQGRVDERISEELGAQILHTRIEERDCWRHVRRLAAIPDSMELAAQYDLDAPSTQPSVDKWVRPRLASIGRSDFKGIILVDALVDTYGRVAKICVVQGAGEHVNRLVVTAVFRTTFAPGRNYGVAVPVWVRLPYRF